MVPFWLSSLRTEGAGRRTYARKRPTLNIQHPTSKSEGTHLRQAFRLRTLRRDETACQGRLRPAAAGLLRTPKLREWRYSRLRRAADANAVAWHGLRRAREGRGPENVERRKRSPATAGRLLNILPSAQVKWAQRPTL